MMIEKEDYIERIEGLQEKYKKSLYKQFGGYLRETVLYETGAEQIADSILQINQFLKSKYFDGAGAIWLFYVNSILKTQLETPNGNEDYRQFYKETRSYIERLLADLENDGIFDAEKAEIIIRNVLYLYAWAAKPEEPPENVKLVSPEVLFAPLLSILEKEEKTRKKRALSGEILEVGGSSVAAGRLVGRYVTRVTMPRAVLTGAAFGAAAVLLREVYKNRKLSFKGYQPLQMTIKVFGKEVKERDREEFLDRFTGFMIAYTFLIYYQYLSINDPGESEWAMEK